MLRAGERRGKGKREENKRILAAIPEEGYTKYTGGEVREKGTEQGRVALEGGLRLVVIRR